MTVDGVVSPTVSVTEFEVTLPRVAEILVPPAATPVAKPLALMVATLGLDEFQVTAEVIFNGEPLV